MNSVKGQFIPDLLLLVSAFTSPGEMKDAFSYLHELFASGGKTKSKLNRDTIFAFIVWVHEFIHFIQFTTRVSGVDYYSFSTSLANYSIDSAIKLKQFLSRNILNFLPIHKHITCNYKSISEIDEISKYWLEYYLRVNRALLVGGWSPRPEQDKILWELLSSKGIDFHPTLKYQNENDEITEKKLNTETILEAEAFIVSTNILRVYFPEHNDEIISELHPNFDENIEFALNLISNGYEMLVPIMADFSMQAASFLPNFEVCSESSYQRVSVAWRFLKAMEICEQYRGINYHDFMTHNKEICEKFNKAFGNEDINNHVNDVVKLLNSFNVSGISRSLSLLLSHNIKVRLNSPNWFYAPETYLPEIHAKLHLPRVKFSHRGVNENSAYLYSMGFGEKSMSDSDQGELLFDCIRRWLGRQLSKTDGMYICPDCLLDYRQEECNNSCFYSKSVNEILKFNPVEYWFGGEDE